MDDKLTKASNVLDEALSKIELLKSNIDNFNLQEQLELSRSIRDHILNSADINNACNIDNLLALKRSDVLDEIRAFQTKTCSSIDVEFIIHEYPQTRFNYSKAKEALIQLTNDEVSDNTEWHQSASDVMSMIEGFVDYEKQLDIVRLKCKNDKYNILLIGEYQSGKTTTFNALCGGRNIGPIGNGIKTSAVPLAVSYSEKDGANIIWKTKGQVVDIFSQLVGYLRKETLSSFDIDNYDSRISLLNEIEELRKHPETKGRIRQEDVQFIILCSFILSYWNSSELQDIKKQNITIDMIGNLTKFPKEMFKRWWKKGHNAFTFSEVVFVYINQIECRCSSEMLKCLNGTIIDCPGLFATKYDTYVTEQAMRDADAIWYIYPRERQAGEQSDDFLTQFKNKYTDYIHKLYATNNLTLWNNNSRSIYEANREDVRSKFGESKKLIPYDAYIAYMGYFKLLYDHNLLDEKIVNEFVKGNSTDPEDDENSKISNFFISEPKFGSFEDAWQYKVSAYTKGKQITANDAICMSQITNIIKELTSFIERNKAYSIIISEGANKLQYILKSLFENLNRSYIEPYKYGQEKLTTLWNTRISRAKQFDKEAAQIVHATLFEPSNGKASLVKRLSDSVYARLFTENVYDSMSESICSKLYAEIDQIKKIREDKSKLERFSADLVTKCISDIIFERVNHWNDLLSSNQDKDFANVFVTDINDMEHKLLKLWNDIYSDDKFIMSNCYTIIKDTASLQINSKEQHSSVNIDNGRVNTVIALNYASIAAVVTGVIGAYVLYLVACVATGPIGWLIGGLTTLIVGFWTSMSIDEYNKKNFRRKILPDLKKQLNDSDLKSSIHEMVYGEIYKLFTAYENNTKIDEDWLLRERDTAISRLDDPKIEDKCYMAVGAIVKILSKNEKYNDYKRSLY